MEPDPAVLDFVAKIGSAVVAVTGLIGVIAKMRRKSAYELLHKQVELIQMLPVDDPRAQRALTHVFEQLERLQNDQVAKTRDLAGTAVAVSLVTLFGGLSVFLLTLQGWWLLCLVVTVPFAGIGLVGFFVSWPRQVRDENGDKIQIAKDTA
ncbi:hypothetical protein [Brevibacterium zhoupengii]|uniref:hypothetical protein n=1 Tax=Brevibacterium zhoupengii TaxID=2898795 RepID=UPI001F08B762|nr:hypothetical protein [Brevibacterium zhoupengii]